MEKDYFQIYGDIYAWHKKYSKCKSEEETTAAYLKGKDIVNRYKNDTFVQNVVLAAFGEIEHEQDQDNTHIWQKKS